MRVIVGVVGDKRRPWEGGEMHSLNGFALLSRPCTRGDSAAGRWGRRLMSLSRGLRHSSEI